VRTRCLDCREWATHKGRCATHHKAYENTRSRQSHSKRREAIARGNNAAARLKSVVKRAGQGECNSCHKTYLASAIDIDHVLPLAKGGEDIDENVQCLCRPCHRLKTREDFNYKRPPF
jgi:5-methylcytosine-specific restriction protein A